MFRFYPEPVVIYVRSFKSHAYTHQKALFHNKEYIAEEVKQATHSGKILIKHRNRVKTSEQQKKEKVNTEVEKEDIQRNSNRQKSYEHNNKVILLGNSILEGIIPERLSNKFVSEKASAFTNSSALKYADKCNKSYKCVVLQMITNEIISKGPAEITPEIESLVLKIYQKWKAKSFIISAAPPVKDPKINYYINYQSYV